MADVSNVKVTENLNSFTLEPQESQYGDFLTSVSCPQFWQLRQISWLFSMFFRFFGIGEFV
jgi:hypothetical protein